MNDKSKRIVRSTVGAGRWFSDKPDELKKEVEGYIDAAEVGKVEGRIVSALAPHAGFVYSGKVAGHTFRALKDSAKEGDGFDTVVVLGFSHRGGFEGVALMDGDAVKSPLGETELDREAGEFLVKESSRIVFDYSPHNGEHSAENEIPFVQAALPKAKLVVGLVGDHDMKTVDELVAALVKLAGQKKIVLVASTDMLHDADYDLVSRTDKATLKEVKKLDVDALVKMWHPRKQVFCGIMPVITSMKFAKKLGAKEGKVLLYRNSGDDHPESRGSWVVGYGSAVFSTVRGK